MDASSVSRSAGESHAEPTIFKLSQSEKLIDGVGNQTANRLFAFKRDLATLSRSTAMLSAKQESRLIGHLDEKLLRLSSRSNKLTKLPFFIDFILQVSLPHPCNGAYSH